MATPGLGDLLATFIRTGTRATVVDANGLKLGTAGALGPADARGRSGRHLVSPLRDRRYFVMAHASIAPRPDDRQEYRCRPRRPAGGRVAARRAAAQKTSCCSRPRRSPSTVGREVPWCWSNRATSCSICATRPSRICSISPCSRPRSPWYSPSASRPSSACVSGDCAPPPIPPSATTARSGSRCRSRAAPMRSARLRGPSSGCWRASTNTRSICARSAASSRTSCARRSPSCVPRSTIWNPRACAGISAATSLARVKAPCGCNRS